MMHHNKADSEKKPIYFDHAAATYLDPEVVRAMAPYWEDMYGNPSSQHSFGKLARVALEDARTRVASIMHASLEEIIFTAGGTESINLALRGVAGMHLGHDKKPHIITTEKEHHAVLNSCKSLSAAGCNVSYLPVDTYGFLHFDALQKSIRPETVLLSVMYANNEIGTLEPLRDISLWLRSVNEERRRKGLPNILFHTDACQAAGFLSVDVQELGIDLMTLNGSKMYGPKQTGILYIREGITLSPLIYGGGQERNLRSGTENLPGVVGFARALELAQEHRVRESERVRAIRDYIIHTAEKNIPDCRLNGPEDTSSTERMTNRLPNNVNMSFKHVDGEILLKYLDRRGICVSTGSACSSKTPEPSHVLTAIHCPEDYVHGTLRVSLGKRNTMAEAEYFLNVLSQGVEEIRQASKISLGLKKIKGSNLENTCTQMTAYPH